LLSYENLEPEVALVISAGKATLHELDSVYGLEDLYNLVEVIMVDAYNKRKAESR
jgi:aromatic ring-opening dioxygenase LigB subunit